MESLCEDYGDLGRALSILARFEEAMAARQGQYTPAGSTAVQRGADLQKLGYGALRQHSLSKQVRATGALGLGVLPASVASCLAALLHVPCHTALACFSTTPEHNKVPGGLVPKRMLSSPGHALACMLTLMLSCLCAQSVVSLGASLVFLPDYFAFIPECVGTLQEREDALDAVHILLEQLREKQEAATKTAAALGPAAQGDKRMVAMNASIHALQVGAAGGLDGVFNVCVCTCMWQPTRP
jgi:hypothetical protein